MIRATLCLTAGLLPLFLFSQWTQQSDFDGGRRLGVMDFELSNEAYICGGLDQTSNGYEAFDDLWKYDASTDAWQALANKPGGNLYGGFAFVIGETAYIGSGANENGVFSNQCWSYNPSSGWTQVAPFPGEGRVYPFSFAIGDKGYVGGGYSGDYEKDCWMYDSQNDQWTAVADYPGGGSVGLASFAIGGKGYAGLGDDGSFYYNDFYEYDPSLDSWSSKANFTGPNRSFAGCVSGANEGFMLGGEDFSGAYINALWRYEPASDDWTYEGDFQGQARRYGALFLTGDTLYYGLGQVGSLDSMVIDDFWSTEVEIEGPASVPEYSGNATPIVYPNPFADRLNLSLPKGVSPGDFRVRVYDARMRLIYEGVSSQVDTESWRAQVYFIEVITGTAIQVVRAAKHR